MNADPEIVALLARKFAEGFMHPGDPERDIPPTPIGLPFKPRPGQPREMSDLLERTAQLLAECVVATIENEGVSDIVPRNEVTTLRRAAGDVSGAPSVASVHCRRCDTSRTDPLLLLTRGEDPDTFLVDGPTLLRGAVRRGSKCPHRVGDTEDYSVAMAAAIRELMIELPAKSLPKRTLKIIDAKLGELLGVESREMP